MTKAVARVMSANVIRSPTKNVFVKRSLLSFAKQFLRWLIEFSVSCLLYCVSPKVGKTHVQAEGTISLSVKDMYSRQQHG